MKELRVFSGDCDKGAIGISIGKKDIGGQFLSTGDIVMFSHGAYVGTNAEQWTANPCLSVIMADENGPFVMGLKTCGFDHPEWRITLVKKFSDVIEGERWPAWGFNYRRAT